METKTIRTRQRKTAKAEIVKPEDNKLYKVGFANFGAAGFTIIGNSNAYSPWSMKDYDKMDIFDTKKFKEIVQACRFFYRHDPIVATTINKLIEIGINDLRFDSNGLSENEMRVFEGLEQELIEFAEVMALEYLISGLVVPEVEYEVVNRDKLKRLGIKKYDTLQLPVTMSLRNPEDITINSIVSEDPSYFIEIPDELVYFIMSKGVYKDGTEDKELYNKLQTLHPDFVTAVEHNVRKIKLTNPLIFRRRPQVDSPYPTPYLFSALESLQHKRNLRRMDYAIAARMIGAIQLFKLGSDEFPVVQGDEDEFEYIKSQMNYRENNGRDIERIFQLFANHTLSITWVTPDVSALLDDTKYLSTNQDIIFALGFPRILITGETERSGTSNPEFAMISPEKTMTNFREKILTVLKDIVYEVATRNRFKSAPEVEFEPLNLVAFKDFSSALKELYDSGNLSRHDYSELFGKNWDDQMVLKEEEQKLLEEKKLGEFAPKPFSNAPQVPGEPNNVPNNPNNSPVKPNNAPDKQQ